MSDLKKQKSIPFLSAKEMRELGPELKEKHQEGETKILNAPRFTSVLRRYTNPESRVIDLGAANGNMFSVLRDIGVLHTYGADIDNYLSKGEPTEGFTAFDFNMDTYPYTDGQFDVATSIEVLEHLENPFHFAREVHRILKKDGVLIFTTPNPSHLFNKITFALRENFYRFLDGNNHITLLTQPIFSKGFLQLFTVEEVLYLYPEMPWRFLRNFTYPANKHFGRSVVYVLRKK